MIPGRWGLSRNLKSRFRARLSPERCSKGSKWTQCVFLPFFPPMTQSLIRHAEQKDLIEDRTLSRYQPYQPIPKVKTGTRSSPHTPDPWPCGRPSCSGNKAEIGSWWSRGLNQLQPLPYIKITSTVAHWHGGPNHFIGDERRVEAQSDGLCWISGTQMRLSVFECGWMMTSASAKAPLAAGEHQRTHDSQQNDSWNWSCACNP